MAWSKEQEQWLIDNYVYAGLNKACEHLDKNQSQVLKKAHRLGLKRKGGGRKPRILNKDGYLWVSYEGGQEAVHRMVMESILQRKLTSEEDVHHIDGNSYNNDPNNLEVVSRSEHLKHHYNNREIDSLGRLK